MSNKVNLGEKMQRFSLLLSLSLLFSVGAAHLRLWPEDDTPGRSFGDDPKIQYCRSWRLSVEANNAGHWKKVPSRCATSVKSYISGAQYVSDSKMVARLSQAYAKSIKLSADHKDTWIFDVDDTLLSNAQHYVPDLHRPEALNETTLDEWTKLKAAPALPWSLWLYKKLQGQGFQLILLTGRKETHRNSTEQNLLSVGYRSWTKLIMREGLDGAKTAIVYKAEKRASLEAEGYRIRGSSGDQWSDLLGSPKANRSFKVPNPMYHIP